MARGRKFQWSIVANFKDYASRKIRGLLRTVATAKKGMGAGAFGGFAQAGQSRLGEKIMSQPGGIGGFFAGIVKGAAGLALLPVRILSGFAALIPGIGGVFARVVGTAANLLQGIVGIAANVVGGIVNAFGKLVAAITRIFTKIVSIAGRILGKIVGIAAKVGLGVGAVIAWQIVKGIRENMKLADIRQVLKKMLGGAAKAVEAFARKLSLSTPFTPMEMLRSSAGIAAVEKNVKRYLGGIVDWAAGAKIALEEAIGVFQRAKSGQFGESMEGLRRGLISRGDMEAAGAKFNKQGSFLGSSVEFIAAMMKVIANRFGGMAKSAAEVGSGPWSTFVGLVQDLRMAVSGPWYDRFNTGLKNINAWLLKIGGGDKIKKVIEWSRAAAAAVDGGISRALNTLATREWSFGNLRKAFGVALDEMGAAVTWFIGLFGRLGKDGPEFGPLALALVEAFKWAAAAIKEVFDVLWIHVGEGLQRALGRVLDKAGSAIHDAMEARQMERARAVYEGEGLFNKPWKGRKKFGGREWEELTGPERQFMVEQADKHDRLNPAETAYQTAMMGLANTLGVISRSLNTKPLTTKEKAAEEADVRAEAAAAKAKHREALGGHLKRAADDVVPATKAGAKRVIDTAAPRKAERQIERERKPRKQTRAEARETSRRRTMEWQADVKENAAYRLWREELAADARGDTAGAERLAAQGRKLMAEAQALRDRLKAGADAAADASQAVLGLVRHVVETAEAQTKATEDVRRQVAGLERRLTRLGAARA